MVAGGSGQVAGVAGLCGWLVAWRLDLAGSPGSEDMGRTGMDVRPGWPAVVGAGSQDRAMGRIEVGAEVIQKCAKREQNREGGERGLKTKMPTSR